MSDDARKSKAAPPGVERCPAVTPGVAFHCVREKGHTGDHRTKAFKATAHVWPQVGGDS